MGLLHPELIPAVGGGRCNRGSPGCSVRHAQQQLAHCWYASTIIYQLAIRRIANHASFYFPLSFALPIIIQPICLSRSSFWGSFLDAVAGCASSGSHSACSSNGKNPNMVFMWLGLNDVVLLQLWVQCLLCRYWPWAILLGTREA